MSDLCRNADCLNPLYAGERPYQIDGLLCRPCQRSPAVQVRVLLAHARERGMSFDVAWRFALGEAPRFDNGRVRWPHDTTHRREWKAVLGSPRSVQVWQACFERIPVPERTRLTLVAVAA